MVTSLVIMKSELVNETGSETVKAKCLVKVRRSGTVKARYSWTVKVRCCEMVKARR